MEGPTRPVQSFNSFSVQNFPNKNMAAFSISKDLHPTASLSRLPDFLRLLLPANWSFMLVFGKFGPTKHQFTSKFPCIQSLELYHNEPYRQASPGRFLNTSTTIPNRGITVFFRTEHEDEYFEIGYYSQGKFGIL